MVTSFCRGGCCASARGSMHSIDPYKNANSKNYFLIGHKLSALIMAQRAAESFSVIFIWRQLGR